MGLVAWYPLNGTLEDYTGNNASLIASANVVWSDGKIGKCYAPNGGSYIRIENPIKSLTKFTVCFWMKEDSSDLWSNVFTITDGTSSNSCRVEKTSTTGDYRWYIDGCFASGVVLFQNNINAWQHVTLKSDGVKVYCYVNGIQTYIANISTINKLPDLPYVHIAMRDTGSKWIGNLNDFRFYDEALSLKEIKEIAKAKILHYNFNQFAEPTENLYKTNAQISISGITPTWINNHTVRFSSTGSTNGIYFNTNITTQTNTYYTLSYDLKKVSGILKHIRGHINTAAGWSIVSTKINSQAVASYTSKNLLEDIHTKNSIEVVLYSGAATTFYYNWIQPNYDDTAVVEIEISNIQVEKNKYSTPFTNNTRTNQRITDASGFRNHSNILNLSSTPQWTQERILGSGAYRFNGSSSIIESTTQNFNGGAYSVSLWFNKSDDLYYHGIFQIYNPRVMRLMGFEGNEMRFHPLGLNSSSPYISFKYEINKWYHVVMTIDDTVAKLYVNGIKIGEVTLETSLKTFNCKDIIIGRDSTDNSRIFNGYIDDVRIYATALSGDDILELYQSRGSVTKNGKLIVNELIETSAGVAGKTVKKLSVQSSGYGGSSFIKLDDQTLLTVGRSYGVVGISKNLSTISAKNFDVYGNADNATALVEYLKALNNTDYIIICTNDYPANNRTVIQEYLSSFNLNFKNYPWTGRDAYIAIFRKNGEIYYENHVKFVSDTTPALINYSMNLYSGNSVNKNGQLITDEIIELPSVNLETKSAYDADWVQIFYHNNRAGTVLFSSDKKEFLRCNTTDKISNLYLLELFRRKDGKFEFLLEYESGGTSYNRWKQSSNFTSQPIAGYEAVQCSWTSNLWGGLEPSNNTSTWVDGSVNHANWFYAIGGRINYSTGGLPNWSGVETGWVKLWVRCDSPNVFKFYKDGNTSSTEFIES